MTDRLRRGSVVALFGLVGIVVVALWIMEPWAGDDAVTPTTTEPAAPPGDRPLPDVSAPMPLDSRFAAVVLRNEAEVVIWGGIAALGPGDVPTRVYTDGAALDLATGTWRVIADSPFPEVPDQTPATAVRPQGVATDAGVVIVSDGMTALWDPDEDSWRALDPAPGEVGQLWSSGPEVLSATARARLDVETGRWTPLPEGPVVIAEPVSAWTGEELVLLGIPTTAPPVGIAFDPATDAWRTLPEVPSTFGARRASGLSAGWDGATVLFVSGDTRQVVAYDPVADGWLELPNTAARGDLSEPVTVAQAGGRRLLLMSDAIMILDGELWRPVPYGGLAENPIIDAPRVGALQGPDASTVLIAALDPETGRTVVVVMDPLEVLGERQAQVGPVTVEIPDRYSPSHVTHWDEGRLVGIVLELELESCSVDAGVAGEPLEPIGPEVTVNAGDPRTWTRHPTGTNWQYVDERHTLTISCSRPEVAEWLARSARFDDSWQPSP